MRYYVMDVSRPMDFYVAGKSILDADWMHYERIAHYYILYVIISGAFHLNIEGEEKSFYPGDVFILPPYARHVGFKTAATTFYWLHFQLQDVQALDSDETLDQLQSKCSDKQIVFPAQFHLPHAESSLILINQIIHNSSHTPQCLVNDYLGTAALLELQRQAAAHIAAEQAQKSRRFEEIVAYIDGNYRENLTVSSIARQFGYNEKYLVRLFQKHTRTSIKGYIIKTRLKVAETLLLSTNDSMAMIAQQAGFSNEYYFMRRFKQEYNMTPLQYRNTYYQQIITKY